MREMSKMKNKFLKKFFACAIVIGILMVPILSGNVAKADYYGTGSGSGGSPGCPGPISTCYGATWQWYDWDKVLAGEYESIGLYRDGRVAGTNSSDRYYTHNGRISDDCSNKPGNGLWRYAMVGMYDYTYSDKGDDGVVVHAGQQLGLLGVDGNSNSKFDTEFRGGWVNYIESGYSMDYVEDIYEELHKKFPELYPLPFWGSGLAWFCGPPDNTIGYAGISNVSNGDVGYATTGINATGSLKTAWTTEKNIKVNEEVTITFLHNPYATQKDKDVSWSVTQSGFNGGYTVVSKNETGAWSGKANLTVPEDKYYAAENRAGSDGSNSYIKRDQYTLKFTNKGSYTFCETLSVGKPDTKAITKACTKVNVQAEDEPVTSTCGNGDLGSYTPNGLTWVLSKSNNSRLTSTYSGWKEAVYAMPSDIVTWKNCYFPGAQKYAYSNVTNLNGKDVAYHDTSHNTCYCTTNGYVTYAYNTEVFNTSGSQPWYNRFLVETTSPFLLNDLSLKMGRDRSRWMPNQNGDYALGDTEARNVDNNYLINYTSDVGQEYRDRIYTPGGPIYAYWVATNHYWTQQCCSCKCCPTYYTCCSENGGCWTCCSPSCCNCTHYWQHCNTYNIGTYSGGTDEEISYVRVPHNFVNTSELSVDRSLVYAGETIGVVNPHVTVGMRQNDATEANYATIVKAGQVKMIAYVSMQNGGSESTGSSSNICDYVSWKNQCVETDHYSGALNGSGNLGGSTEYPFGSGNLSYNVFDASAGDYMCFAIAVYPHISGRGSQEQIDTNWSDAEGDHEWYVSAPKCAKIAKKPSAQIIGGDLYSGGDIRTNVSEKRQLWKVSGYGTYVKSGGSVVTNGSWVEEGITSRGLVTGLSSGASLGWVMDARETGLIGSADYCTIRAPLSIANYSNWTIGDVICPYTPAVGLSNISSTVKNRKALADYWRGDGDGDGSSYISLTNDDGNIASATGKNIKLYSTDGSVTVGGGSITTDTTRIVKAGGTVTISDNIEYNAAGMTSSGNVPKVVIYGNNIEIACNVTRVDAILIAENNVVTCQGYTGSNNLDAQARANILEINGIVISNKIDLGRTYGNSVGNGTGKAAETINYDTSALIWGRFMAGTSESDTMTVTYQHELAPRY